ncbi:MAG: hypothetical protein WCH62_08030, partial [Candidatus Omnitrophota bacterium]
MKGFHTYTGIGFEIDKDAAWDYIHDGYLLSPRTVLKGRTKHLQSLLPAIPADSNKLSLEVQAALVAAMGEMVGENRAIMFSGGFDSMLIGLLAQHCGAKVSAITVQFDDFNLLTVAGAVEFSKKAGIMHH